MSFLLDISRGPAVPRHRPAFSLAGLPSSVLSEARGFAVEWSLSVLKDEVDVGCGKKWAAKESYIANLKQSTMCFHKNLKVGIMFFDVKLPLPLDPALSKQILWYIYWLMCFDTQMSKPWTTYCSGILRFQWWILNILTKTKHQSKLVKPSILAFVESFLIVYKPNHWSLFALRFFSSNIVPRQVGQRLQLREVVGRA